MLLITTSVRHGLQNTQAKNKSAVQPGKFLLNINQYYTNMPCECGYPDGIPEGRWFSRGRSPSENHPPEGRHSIRIPTLAWHICFIILNKPQFGKISMKTTITAGRTVDVLPVDISPVDMMEWPTFVSQSRLTIFT